MIAVYRCGIDPVWQVKFSPLGYYFVTASRDRTARMWAIDKMAPLRTFVGHLSDVDVCNIRYIQTNKRGCIHILATIIPVLSYFFSLTIHAFRMEFCSAWNFTPTAIILQVVQVIEQFDYGM